MQSVVWLSDACWSRFEGAIADKYLPIKIQKQASDFTREEPTVSEHYHDAGDLHFLKEMGKLAPTDFKAWLGLNNIVGSENGKIPKKYRELIAIAVACTTQCPYCIAVHSKAAKAAGATREEIAESAFVAAALRAGGAATHGAMALKFFDAE
jgi:AhpD family alkylhydroperoxidase